MAPMMSSGGSLLLRGAGRQGQTTTIIAMNEAALRKKTAHGPDAPMMQPPNAGPIARATLIPTTLSVIAAGKSVGRTNSGVIACQTGLLIAVPMPRRKVRESRRAGVIWPVNARTPIAPAATTIQICMTSSRRRRSTMSASAPAGRAISTTGKLPNVSTSATSTGEGVNEVINHDSPTSCIHVPMLDTTVAIQSARNTDSRSGLQADARLPASLPSRSLAKGIFLADFDIPLDQIPKTYTVTAKCLVALKNKLNLSSASVINSSV